jgi:hypothetical protein
MWRRSCVTLKRSGRVPESGILRPAAFRMTLLILLALIFHGCEPAFATVSTTGVSAAYTGDGSTNSFAYPDYLFEVPDLIVTQTISGVTTNYPFSGLPGFTWAGTPDCNGSYPSGGAIAFQDGSGNPAPPAAGASILITRATPKTQTVQFFDNNPLSACVIEHAYDKLTLMAQEGSLFIGLSNGPPVSGVLSAPCAQLGAWYQNAAVVAGGNFGWVCTTVGIAGAAVWSPFGLVSQ